MHGTRNRLGITPLDALKWAQQYETTRTYLSKLNGDHLYKSQYLYYYCNWSKYTPLKHTTKRKA
jgi:hypothetical protein